MVREIALTPRQNEIVLAPTPQAMVKSKPGRGGRKVSYVEGGYVVSVLNAAFSPLGWDFEIVEHGESNRSTEKSAEGEVWVKGKLTIIDHKQGFRVSKTQFGQHPIHKNVPIGDAYKAAATDCLKKCASLLGIALDVYWGQDEAPKTGTATTPKLSANEQFERAKLMVNSTRDVSVLIEYDEKLSKNDKSVFNAEQKKSLHELVTKRVSQLEADQSKKG